jgi:hypothetical protein
MTKQEIIALIYREAIAAQLDPACMVRIAEIESSLDPNRVNRSGKKPSLAAGLYQIMPFHNVANVLDPLTNIRWAINFTKQNHEYLRKNSIPVNCFTTYLCHQQGAAGAVILWNAAKAGQRISDLTSKIQIAVRNNVGANDFSTVEQFLRFWERKINKSPVSLLPDAAQIPLARVDAHVMAGATAAVLGIATTLLVTRFVEKTTIRKALQA